MRRCGSAGAERAGTNTVTAMASCASSCPGSPMTQIRAGAPTMIGVPSRVTCDASLTSTMCGPLRRASSSQRTSVALNTVVERTRASSQLRRTPGWRSRPRATSVSGLPSAGLTSEPAPSHSIFSTTGGRSAPVTNHVNIRGSSRPPVVRTRRATTCMRSFGGRTLTGCTVIVRLPPLSAAAHQMAPVAAQTTWTAPGCIVAGSTGSSRVTTIVGR